MTEKLLGRPIAQYADLGAQNTAEEIIRQPSLWRGVLESLNAKKGLIQNFLKKHIHLGTRIIFTGAGSSEFVGNTVVPYLRQSGLPRVFSIATTDLVLAPESYINKQDDLLLISFARSGSSPESLAALHLADELARSCAHLVLTCNPEGELARQVQGRPKALVFLIEEAHDLGFAMTGSFTSMLLAAFLLFQTDRLPRCLELYDAWMEGLLGLWEKQAGLIISLTQRRKKRLVCLGSGFLKGIAQEAHLKILELSSSLNVANFDSSLGFRHGPKSVMNDETLVMVFVSPHAYTQRYDEDMLKELMNTSGEHRVLAISPYPLNLKGTHYHDEIILPSLPEEVAFLHALSAITLAQLYALENAIGLGVGADEPSPSGQVNRVVEGVNIYPYTGGTKS